MMEVQTIASQFVMALFLIEKVFNLLRSRISKQSEDGYDDNNTTSKKEGNISGVL